MKFWVLFKKELREMVTLQTVIGMLVSVLVFLFIGNFMSGVTEDMQKESGTIQVVDQDQSDLSAGAIAALKENGFTVNMVDTATPSDENGILLIPKGFSENLNAQKAPEIKILARVQSFAMTANMKSELTRTAASVITEYASSFIAQKGNITNADLIKNPVKVTDETYVGEKSANVAPSILSAFGMSQTILIPMVVFLLITFASQMTVSAIANEKGDKTLETLLSTPVSRLSVLSAKICAAGLVSLLMAGVYMIGFSGYMNGFTGGATAGSSTVMETLGLTLSAGDFVLIGVQLFLTILIALGLALILGSLAQDVKSAQTAIAPLMFLLLIPYMITIFVDVNSLPLIGKLLVCLIPFTHTFIASSNLIFGDTVLFLGGLLYQIVFLVVVMALAVRIFSTDRIFTMKLQFGKKKKNTAGAQ